MKSEEKITAVIDNQIIELDEELDKAKMAFADACLSENWEQQNENKVKCKVIEGQKGILKEARENLLAIFEPAIAVV